MEKHKILIVDDDLAVCSSISLLLKRAGHESHFINNPKLVFEKLRELEPDLILLDMNFTIDTSGKKGLEVLQEIRLVETKTPIILMTGWATVQLAVKGMKIGANDFIAKPWDNKQLLSSVSTLLELDQQHKKEAEKRITNFEHIIGEDPAFLEVLNMAQRVSKTDASVLIIGDSGTGKELIAEAIHYESLRKDKPFVKVNLGGISSSLFESEMFGHIKGAYTDASTNRVGRFELADTGTIFLDEIGDLEASSQVKLLRVLQEKTFEPLGSSQTKKVDVRVVSATNKNLEQMVAEGFFREDLFYRINLIRIFIPSLAKRPTDIPLLVKHFINNLRMTYDSPDLTVSKQALEWLQNQNFPGNIRQLKNLVESTVLISNNQRLEMDDFRRQYQATSFQTNKVELPSVGSVSLEEMEVQMIKKALAFHHNKIVDTAKSLGITRSTLYRRLAKYNIPYDA